MSIVPFESEGSLIEAIRSEAMANGNLSIRGVARLAGVADHKTIVSGGDLKSAKLAQKLAAQGFLGGDLIADGFPPQAVILVLEYFAFESKVKSQQAIALLRTFGTIGLMKTLKSINEPEQPKAPQTYLEALKALVAVEEQKELLRLQNEQLAEEVEQLSEAVDELFNYSSIIRIAKLNCVPETKFSWRKLKAATVAMGLEVKQVPCPRFVTKNLYPHEAWRYCYPNANFPETTTLTIASLN